MPGIIPPRHPAAHCEVGAEVETSKGVAAGTSEGGVAGTSGGGAMPSPPAEFSAGEYYAAPCPKRKRAATSDKRVEQRQLTQLNQSVEMQGEEQ